MKVDYSYQQKSAQIVFNNALNKQFIASVLAACPSAGKTTISHHVINLYVAKFPQARILVLTEGQNTLKNQYISELNEAHVALNFTYGGLDSDTQVRVGLPQSIQQLSWSSIDFLIVDEAHRFYQAEMVTKLINTLKPKHVLLMTGSPTEFNLHNQGNTQRKYGIHYIAAEDLQKMGVFSGADMDVVRTINADNAVQTIRDSLAFAQNKKADMSKIMVACPSIRYAQEVAEYMKSVGYLVSLSTSQDDKDDQEIANFRSGQTNVLVVVGKGILGFNDKMITLLLDLKSSDNLDASYQLFARVLRKHPKNVVKSYYRIADKDFNKQVLTLHKMLALMKKSIFMGYNGMNLKIELGV